MSKTPGHKQELTMFPEEKHIEHIKQYFSYEHLPERLQATSKQFHELAAQIDVGCNMPEVLANLFIILEVYEADVSYHLEIDALKSKMRSAAKELFERRYVEALRLILEAKDCAVRASL